MVGPFPVQPPLADGGTHDVAEAAFIGPLTVGTHHVRSVTTFRGSLVRDAYHVSFLRFGNDVPITVVP